MTPQQYEQNLDTFEEFINTLVSKSNDANRQTKPTTPGIFGAIFGAGDQKEYTDFNKPEEIDRLQKNLTQYFKALLSGKEYLQSEKFKGRVKSLLNSLVTVLHSNIDYTKNLNFKKFLESNLINLNSILYSNYPGKAVSPMPTSQAPISNPTGSNVKYISTR